MRRLPIATAALMALCSACSGTVQDTGGGPDEPGRPGEPAPGAARPNGMAAPAPTSTPSPAAPPRASCPAGPQPGVAPLRRLTNQQYVNTLRDLLGGVTAIPDVALPAENVVEGFSHIASGQTASLALLEGYQGAARDIATNLIATGGVPKLAPCAMGADENTCGDTFIKQFGKRAWRRPLAADEATRLSTLFRAQRTASGYATAVAVTLQAMLMAPQFVYRLELGATPPAGKSVAPLTSYEIASRLSYLLWDTLPDAALMAAADADKLQTTAGIEEQARRLMADPRARPTLSRFFRQWLRLSKLDTLDKDRKAFPAFNDSVAQAMRDSVGSFLDYVFWNDGKLSSLLTDTHAYVNPALAPLYDQPAPAGTMMTLVDLGPAQRAGVMTQVGVMAALAKPLYDSPVFRGLFVLECLMCQQMPPPPPDVPPLADPRPMDPPRTTRQRQEQSHSPPACAACHKRIDGIGFGFEHYDAVGHWRTQDNGVPVDATGEFVGTLDMDGKFDGAVDMARKLAGSAQVRACAATQWFRYAFGRIETPDDACALAPLVDAFEASRGDMKALVVSIATSDAFRFRQVTP